MRQLSTYKTRSPHLKIWSVLIFVIALIKILFEMRDFPRFGTYVPLAVAALLIYVPIIYAGIHERRLEFFDRSGHDYLKSFRIFFISVILVLPPFLIGNHFWQEFVFHKSFMPRMVPSIGLIILDQLFLVAIPEEIFFRGWFQSELNRIWSKRVNLLGVMVGPGYIVTAIVFAAAHSIIHYQWWHFSIFFPALLFGWLREKTGNITAPSLWHCLANLCVYWIGSSYV